MKRILLLAICVLGLMACAKKEPAAPDTGIEAVSCIERCTATCDRKCCTHQYWGRKSGESCKPCYGPAAQWDCTITLVCHKPEPECRANCCSPCPEVTPGCQIS